jgi:hypothetical protein
MLSHGRTGGIAPTSLNSPSANKARTTQPTHIEIRKHSDCVFVWQHQSSPELLHDLQVHLVVPSLFISKKLG